MNVIFNRKIFVVKLFQRFMNKIIFRSNASAGKLLQLSAILIVLNYFAFAQERTWQTFSPENNAWSILAPGVMKPDREALETSSAMGSYTYSDSTGFFAVIYRDTPKGRLLWKPIKNSYFKKVRKNFIKSNKGKLLKDVEFSNGTVKGREVYIKVPDGAVLDSENKVRTKYRLQRSRMFFYGKRFYLLLAVLPEQEIDDAAVTNYFNSFVLK